MKDKLKDRKWFPYTVAACVAVALYVVLANIGAISGAIGSFLGHFSSIFLGLVLAYLMNPLAKLFNNRILRVVKKDGLRWTLSVLLAVIVILLALGFILGTLIPQLADSVINLVNNMDGYLASLQALLDRLGLGETFDLSEYFGSGGSIGKTITAYLIENVNNILNMSATAGKAVGKWAIALILSVYMLMAKDSLKKGSLRLMHAITPQKRLDKQITFLTRCDRILSQYIVFSLLDALIVGVVNALFMTCFGMQYAGLVSMVVAVTNLIPTFGPIVGGVIGAFILLLVKPLHALIFIIFTFVLQFFDGYILKPKLFGNTLGVSGLLILIAILVLGSMFGIVGILLAIPAAAIFDFIYKEELLPMLERRRARIEAEAEKRS